MRAIIVAFGVVMIVAGLGPVKEYAPIAKPIRVHDIEHYKCRSTCVLVDGEFFK